MRRLLAVLPVLTLGVLNCYSTGDGTPPPLKSFYYPVGLQVSHGGSVLYAVNSDFDLQFNGGTVQSYDLHQIREDVVDLIKDPRAPNVPVLNRSASDTNPCSSTPPVIGPDGVARATLGNTCAPPVDSAAYVKSTVVIGAFATDLLLSDPPYRLAGTKAFGARTTDRLFMPVRGDGSLTWIQVDRDDPAVYVPAADRANYGPFALRCGQDGNARCDGLHRAGVSPDELGNNRHITMPGEPFGVAFSEDGESLVITHQNDTKASLFTSGLARDQNPADVPLPPALEYILDGLPYGGVGVVPVPHDPNATTHPLASFLWTSRNAGEVDLLRRYPDQVGSSSAVPIQSALRRPFLDREAAFPISASAGGADSRGIAIDPTPRLICKLNVAPENAASGRTGVQVAAEKTRCAEKPARVFIANRSPAALLVGDLGGSNSAGTFDPDRLVIHTSIPLSNGPSRLYLAPIVDVDGTLALRVFVVCFDSAAVYVYDPESLYLENVIRVASGPFSMAFDPFTFDDIAARKIVPIEPQNAARGLRSYRFGYLTSFTESFVQIIDFDKAQPDKSTYEKIVFTLGQPTRPKGS